MSLWKKKCFGSLATMPQRQLWHGRRLLVPVFVGILFLFRLIMRTYSWFTVLLLGSLPCWPFGNCACWHIRSTAHFCWLILLRRPADTYCSSAFVNCIMNWNRYGCTSSVENFKLIYFPSQIRWVTRISWAVISLTSVLQGSLFSSMIDRAGI